MLTIAVLSQKGGCGKSMLATNLAATAHLAGKRTLLIDMDVQGTSLEWSAARGDASKLAGLVTVKADRAMPLPRMREMASGYDVVLLDGPPRIGDVTRSAACAADIVVIPVQPSASDFWTISETLKLLDSADEIRAELGRRPVRRAFVLNRASASTTISRQAPAALDGLGELLGTVCQRVVFAEVVSRGEAAVSDEPSGAGALEIRRLYRALLQSEAA